jgi:transposase
MYPTWPGPKAASRQLACWAGLTPKHHESDTHVHRGRITKHGSRLVRWAAVEPVKRVGPHAKVGAIRDRVAARRGADIHAVAAARQHGLVRAGPIQPG